MSPPNGSRPGIDNDTRATSKSNAKDYEQGTPCGYSSTASQEVNRG